MPSALPPPPLSMVRAWTCLGVNLLATPGLGSVWGGRKVAGRVQLFFSVTGFCLFVLWIFKISVGSVEAQISEIEAPPIPAWWWQCGLLAFGIAWVWSFATSVSLLLEARKNDTKIPPKLAVTPKPVPPKL